MKNKNSNTLMLLTGIIAGAATVYFLKSKKGQEVVDLLLEETDNLKSKIIETKSSIIEEGKLHIENTLDNTKSIVTEAKEKLKTISDKAKTKTGETLNEFQKGIAKAKEELEKA